MFSKVVRSASRLQGFSRLKYAVACTGLMKIPIISHEYCTMHDTIAKRQQFLKTQIARHFGSSSGIVWPVFLRAENFQDKTAIANEFGHYTYADLLHYSASLAAEFNSMAVGNELGRSFDKDSKFPLAGERIAFLCENDMSYVVTQWAIWMCGAIAVPLSKSHPVIELGYFAHDSGATLLVCIEKFREKMIPVAKKLGVTLKVLTVDSYSGDYEDDVSHWQTDKGRQLRQALDRKLTMDSYKDTTAQIVYTSGTTGRPKGVVHTFGNLHAMMQGMISAWGWTDNDVILHVLPLHHVHGIVNVLLTPLYCGATCVMMQKFQPDAVWKTLLSHDPPINMFMAVPTIYAKLLEEYDRQKHSHDPYIPDNAKEILTEKVRLMVSGSAALPETIMKKWEELTGHTLLERYGTTETGMVLTNPLHGQRIPGTVGKPFPGVSVQIVDNEKSADGFRILAKGNCEGMEYTQGHEDDSGELLVKGDNVLKEYWNKPKDTVEAFTEDGWFKTGDTAMLSDGVVKIVGRTSVDLIKSGGYRISALEVERRLLECPEIRDVVVIGIPDETWGQLVTAVVVLKPGNELTLEYLRQWCEDRMAHYQIPRVLKVMEELPRNSMGKVNKKDLARVLFPKTLNKN